MSLSADYKVNKFYKYSEEPSEDRVVFFGWEPCDEFVFDQPVVLSYHSQTKFSDKKQRKWSSTEGKNAVTVGDYIKYFKALTSDEPESFYSKWKNNDNELKAHWETLYPEGTNAGQHLFIFKIAELLATGKKFIMFSRGFKIIEPELEKNKATGRGTNEEGDTT